MAENDENGDKTEEATPERRDEYREKGQVATSREVTTTLVLLLSTFFVLYFLPYVIKTIKSITVLYFSQIGVIHIDELSVVDIAKHTWADLLMLIVPIFGVTAVVAISSTLIQTRFNFSWKKLEPNFSKMNPLSGLKRMVSAQSAMELFKSIAKLCVVITVALSVIYGELKLTPGLLNTSLYFTWSYWGRITTSLFWTVGGLLTFIAVADYIFNFFQLEKQMKMSKQDIKEELKRREVDPMLKGRMRRMAREYATRKMVKATAEATVVITNPTHYSIAIKYEWGMPAPIVVAKGMDFLALRMREVAKEFEIPMVENRVLARSLYNTVEVDDEIPESLYKVVSEVIKYVFKIKNIKPKTPGAAAT